MVEIRPLSRAFVITLDGIREIRSPVSDPDAIYYPESGPERRLYQAVHWPADSCMICAGPPRAIFAALA